MEDPELEAIRKQRLAELQSQMGENGEVENQKANADQIRAQQDAKNTILSQILDQQARARLNTLLLGKPEKGQAVENMLIRMAQTRQIRSKIDEGEFIRILEDVNAQLPHNKPSVKFDRRRAALDSDEDI